MYLLKLLKETGKKKVPPLKIKMAVFIVVYVYFGFLCFWLHDGEGGIDQS